MEMPITKFDVQGNFNPNATPKYDRKNPQYGYNWQDEKLMTNPKAIAKIIDKFSNTKQNFEIYVIKSPDYRSAPYGSTNPEYLQRTYNVDIQPNPNSITMFYTNN